MKTAETAQHKGSRNWLILNAFVRLQTELRSASSLSTGKRQYAFLIRTLPSRMF